MNNRCLFIKAILLVSISLNLDFAYAEDESASVAATVSNDVFTPYTATYQVFRDNKHIGKAKRVLEKVSDHQFKLSSTSEASIFFYSFESSEESEFDVVNNQLQVQKFSYWDKRTFKSKKKIKQLFDWQTMLETGTKNKQSWQRSFNPDSYDTLNYILRLRLDLANGKTDSFVYQVNDEGSEKTYTLRYDGFIKVETKGLSSLACQKVTRYRATSTRLTSLCFAPSLHYIPIMISQSKDGEEQASMIIDSVSLAKN